jgi:ubiquinone/menaquinone biosynthesis C-methylase UbiE
LCASRFDSDAGRYVAAALAKDWSPLVEMCRPLPADRALDVGAGPALLSAALAPLVARAVALDPSQALLAHAPEGVKAVVGRGEAIPFGDGSFDLVTSVNSLHHVDDIAATLAEMARVLAAGGRIVVQDYLADSDPVVAERWELVERLRAPDHRRLLRPGEVEQLLAGHGLVLEQQHQWVSTWQLEPWMEMAGTAADDAERIRELVGADRFTLTAWRARFAGR